MCCSEKVYLFDFRMNLPHSSNPIENEIYDSINNYQQTKADIGSAIAVHLNFENKSSSMVTSIDYC